MIVIECKIDLRQEEVIRLWQDLTEQAQKGLVVLPEFCRVVAVTRENEEIEIHYSPPENWDMATKQTRVRTKYKPGKRRNDHAAD